MNRKHVIGRLRKREIIGGLLYLPMFLYGTQVLAYHLVRFLLPEARGVDLAAWVNLAFGLINFCVLVPIFLPYLQEQFSFLRLRGLRALGDIGIALALYYGLSMTAGYLLEPLLEQLQAPAENANQTAVAAIVRQMPLLTLLDVCLLAPLCEELLCRGLIFCGLYRHSPLLAYGLSMLAFSLMHVYQYLFSQSPLLSLINAVIYLPAGFVLGWVYARSESIWSAIILHIFLNIISALAVLYL